jgi:hypothetical protein
MWHKEGVVLIPEPTMAPECVELVKPEMHTRTGEGISWPCTIEDMIYPTVWRRYKVSAMRAHSKMFNLPTNFS